MSRSISLLAMGGTISTSATPTGATPALGAEQIAANIVHHRDEIEICPRDVAKISGNNISLQDMWKLAQVAREEVDQGADGIVITHGTDTLEETVYALSLLLDRQVPVIVTGAMRTPESPGADGPANLRAAITVASDPSFARFGPVVVFHDEIHLARWVSKTHSAKVRAFTSPSAGPIGHLAEDSAIIVLEPPKVDDCLPRIAEPHKRVEMLWAYTGSDELIVDSIAKTIDGLVVAGSGVGHVSGPMAEAMMRVANAGVPVVLASRCADGQVLEHTYGGLGSETQLLSDGIHSAGGLSPIKARLRLAFGLSAGVSPEELFPRISR